MNKHILGQDISSDLKEIRQALQSITPNYETLRKNNIKLTKQAIKESVTPDILLIQTLKSIKEIDSVLSHLLKKAQEWIALSNPEFIHNNPTQEALLKALQENKQEKQSSFGAPLEKQEQQALDQFIASILHLKQKQQLLEQHIQKQMQKLFPHLSAMAGPLLGLQLIEHVGSLKKLALLPASTIQVLGAEKALFRHLTKGSRPPKYGLLHEHPLVLKAKKQHQGKTARVLADKIALGAKLDYFKAENQVDKLQKDLNAKLP